jgi:hypothetical protein
MDPDVVTRILLERSPHLTQADAHERAREFCRRARRLGHGWRMSLELLTLTYRYEGLSEAEARLRAEEFRGRLQVLNRKSSRSRKRFRRLCLLTDEPYKLLDGER